MKIRNKHLILALPLLFMAISLDTFGQITTNDNQVTNLSWKAGNNYELEMTSVPGEGYVWELVNYFDSTVVRFVKKTFVPDPDTTFHGKVGKEIFTFRTLKKGQATLSLAYRQPWEATIPRLDKYIITVEK